MTARQKSAQSSLNSAPRVVSGITPSGSSLHIGNYFGAIQPQLALQETHEAFYFVADLHALTTVHDPIQMEQNILGVVLDYLALGVDPERSVFFRQSDAPDHSRLAVILANFVSYGQMQRMHAFKDKLQKETAVESINMGLFNYPILMAADILAYQPMGVPVGEDQRQHVELTRDIAENLNRACQSEVLRLPEALISREVGRVIGTDGQRKMSKSLGNIVGIFDDPTVIERQIMSSYTDPNRKRATDPGQVEGNTVFLYHDLINDDPAEVAELKRRYTSGTVGDVEVKQRLVAAHQRKFAAARQRRAELASDLNQVRAILASGASRAAAVSHHTLDQVTRALGLTNSLTTH